ncbi:unnamed protein product, partial [Meganyctiphanes norvegica]
EDIHADILKALKPYLEHPEFEPDNVSAKSMAAGGLCSWVINTVRFYEVFCDVEPKRIALEKANTELETARTKLEFLTSKVKGQEEVLARLKAEYEAAFAEKQRCEEEANRTAITIELANRLVGGLASEKIRWAEAVAMMQRSEKTLPGDILLLSAFISYM